MRLAFANTDIRLLCEDFEAADIKFGPKDADLIHIGLADLRAATSLEDIISMNSDSILSDGNGLFFLTLTYDLHLVFGYSTVV